MPTLAIKTIKNRRNASGNINIYISLTFKREIRYIPTGFEIYDEAEFEDGKVCYRRDAAILNKRLAFILNEYKSKLKRDFFRKDACLYVFYPRIIRFSYICKSFVLMK